MMRIFIYCLLLTAVLAAKRPRKIPAKKRNDAPKRVFLIKSESMINLQLVRATTVEIGFSYIQGAEGFLVTAKEWIDNSFVQSVATDTQTLSVQERSATLRNLIPGREYLIQMQAIGKNRKPFGEVSGRVVRTSQMCYTCNGVSDNGDCEQKRDVVECPHDKDACSNVVRFDNDQISISKRCAQYNPALTKSCDRSDNAKDSVCRCMCRSNLCNKQMLPCVDECIDELPMPLRSSMKCSNGRRLGSVCKWECNTGYALKGLGESKCREDRTWSVMSPPECVLKPNAPRSFATKRPTRPSTTRIAPVRQCRPFAAPAAAELNCDGGNKLGSTCTITCKFGFSHEGGSGKRICGRNLKWTGTPIVCKEIKCPTVSEDTGVVKCSNDTKIGSVCDVITPSTMTCKSDGSWAPSHRCTQVGLFDLKATASMCEALSAPEFGSIRCTSNNEEGSLCEFGCASGYALQGISAVRECSKGKWTGHAVTCVEKTCSALSDKSYIKEVVKCSNGNKIGSLCEVITPSVVACQSDGSWSLPLNQESRCKECKCP